MEPNTRKRIKKAWGKQLVVSLFLLFLTTALELSTEDALYQLICRIMIIISGVMIFVSGVMLSILKD